MHIVHGQLRKPTFIKPGVGKDGQSTMYGVELSEMTKDYQTGEKTYTNYKAILFAQSDAHVNHYNTTLVEGNFIVLTSEKLKIEVSECGQYIKLFMDNARLEGSGYIQPQDQGFQQQVKQEQMPSKQLAQKKQQAAAQKQQKANPQEPSIDFDDDIPF
jgi:hypothetical protein